MRFNILYIFFGLYLALHISCTRTPPNTSGLKHLFEQGTTDELHNIDVFRPLNLRTLADEFKADNSKLEDDTVPPFLNDDLMDKILQVRTADNGQLAKISSSRSGVSIEPKSNVSFVNQYYFLNYQPVSEETEEQKLLSDLLGHIEGFKGFPNTTYYIIPQLQDNYLVLYRVGKKETIPYDEKHLAIKIGDWFATPLVGYAIEYCEPERIFNADYEETNVYRPKCYAVARRFSEYIQLNGETKTVFQYAPKLDVFPSNFFDGQWYTVQTVVKSSEKASEEIGHQTFENALLVEFQKTTNGLQAVDASGYQLKEEDQLASLFIPVEWKEYKMARDTNILRQLAEQESERQVDIQRPYFKINFQELLSLMERAGSNEDRIERTEIRNILITDNYFSYIVETRKVDGTVQWMKYAFKKAKENSNYQEKQWYEEDSSQFFPSFMAYRSHYIDSSVYTSEDRGRFYRITRFDPNSKVITWYFSKQTSRGSKIRRFGKMAVALWNRAFQIAGNGQIKIVLNEEEEKELGDIRYNIINLIETQSKSDSGVLGFGPNIYNPITGEIVSATANIWVTAIVDSYVNLVRQYIRFHLYPPEWKLLPDSEGVSTFIYERIKQICIGKNDVNEFINDYKKKDNFANIHPDESTIDDKTVVEDCAWKLAQPKLLQVTLHEMGHGFGLRHVFSASADEDNFYTSYNEVFAEEWFNEVFAEEWFNEKFPGMDIIEDTMDIIKDTIDIDLVDVINVVSSSEEDLSNGDSREEDITQYEKPAKYSSVMDYTAHQYPKLTVPGKYDVAAIRFIYFDQVELANETGERTGETLEIPYLSGSERKQKSIIDYAEEQGQLENLYRYHVCGGKLPTIDNYHSSEMNADDPLCAKYDYGQTPLEIVQNVIYDSQNALMMQTKRYDRAHIPPLDPLLYSLDPGNSLLPLLYKWYDLLDVFFNEDNKTLFHFSSLDSDDVKEYRAALTGKAEQDSIFEQYGQVGEKIFNYFKQIFFFPFKHCMYLNESESSFEVWALEAIVQLIEGQHSDNDNTVQREVVLNCSSEAVNKWAEDKGLELESEIGFIGVKDSYFLDKRKEDTTDEVSVFKPIESSGGQTQSIWSMILNKLLPILLEPGFRSEMRTEWLHYIKTGVDPNFYGWRFEDFPKLRELKDYELDLKLETLYTRIKRYIDLQTAIFQHTTDFSLRREITQDISCRNYTIPEFYEYMRSVPINFFRVGLVDSNSEGSASNLIGSEFIQEQLTFFISEERYDLRVLHEGIVRQFTDFIVNHSRVYRADEKEVICIPEGTETFFAQIFDQFNKNEECLYNHENNKCEDRENKEAFNLAVIRLMSSEVEGL